MDVFSNVVLLIPPISHQRERKREVTCANYPSGGTLPVRHGKHFLSEIKHTEWSVGRRGQMTAIILWILVSMGGKGRDDPK